MTSKAKMSSIALGVIAVIAITSYVFMTPYNRMPMGYDFTGEIIAGQTEPLYTWEVFYWTPR